jgi:hypothetical protein
LPVSSRAFTHDEPSGVAANVLPGPVRDAFGLESPEEREARRRRREEKRREDAHRPLDAWERYRALNDAMDEAYELVDIANREARFALILMGGLNAVFFLIATRPELGRAIPEGARTWMGIGLVFYAFVSLYFFLQAVETLRPRRCRPQLPPPTPDTAGDHPLGIRYYEDVIRRDAVRHLAVWREVRIGQLNAELALQVHSLSLKNEAKYAALRRLYGGLRLISLLVAAFLFALVFFGFTSPATV